jgi:hypothetical protein
MGICSSGEALKTDKRKPPIRRSEALRDAPDWEAVGDFLAEAPLSSAMWIMSSSCF